MRLAQLTQAYNPFRLAVTLTLLAQLIPLAATGAQRLNPYMSHNRHLHRKRLSSSSRLDDCPDDEDMAKCLSKTNTLGCNPFDQNNRKQTATNIAQCAAEEAIRAYGTQQVAATEMARKVKLQLAAKAFTAAKATEAALAGKLHIVRQIEAELHEGIAILEQENEACNSAQENLKYTCLTEKQLEYLHLVLQKALRIASDNLGNAKSAVCGAQHMLAEKEQLSKAAAVRIRLLRRQLAFACKDFEIVKRFAYKAACAAKEARQRVERDRRRIKRQQRRKRKTLPK